MAHAMNGDRRIQNVSRGGYSTTTKLTEESVLKRFKLHFNANLQ